MTVYQLRQEVVKKAESLVGLKESDGSFKTIIDAYNRIRPLPRGYRMSYTDAWCAAFVSAVGEMCGLTDVLLPECSCSAMITLYRRRGLYHTDGSYGVQPGDLIFYDWDGNESADHVGIITRVSSSGYDIVEGNNADAVCRRAAPKRWKYIVGFASPDYALAADKETGREPEKGEAQSPAVNDNTRPVTDTAQLPLLRAGSRGISVQAMQAVLIVRDFSCGPDGADGVFGANTESAVRRFQKAFHLQTDGICGPATWGALLGVTE